MKTTINDAVYCIETPGRGKGVFAGRAFLEGETVLTFEGPILREHELFDPDHCLQIARDLYLGPSGKVDDYVNHSCDPNCGYMVRNGTAFLMAVKHIAPDEEITFDYSTSMHDLSGWTLQCCCGSAECRRVIGDYRTLPEALRRRYEQLGAAPDFLHEDLE